MRDVVWQKVHQPPRDDDSNVCGVSCGDSCGGGGNSGAAGDNHVDNVRVIEQEARWRWGWVRGSSRMTVEVTVNDADAEAQFKLVKPATANAAATAATAATSAVASASSTTFKADDSVMLEDYHGVMGVSGHENENGNGNGNGNGDGNGDGDVVVYMRGHAKVSNVFGKGAHSSTIGYTLDSNGLHSSIGLFARL